MDKDIGKIQKGEYQGTVTEIVVGIREYNGKVGVDIREFVTGEQYTGPTKKGLRIPAESFVEFREMVNSVNLEELKPTEDSEPKESEEPKGPESPKGDEKPASDQPSDEEVI